MLENEALKAIEAVVRMNTNERMALISNGRHMARGGDLAAETTKEKPPVATCPATSDTVGTAEPLAPQGGSLLICQPH